jgi:pimeloyl-ACP methyl ester carboxylesterase
MLASRGLRRWHAVTGSRPHALLVPGQLLTAECWRLQLAALGDLLTMTVADHTGHDTVAGLAEAIVADAPAAFTLIAHAMGGFVAFEIMRRWPERVTRLALMSTLAPADTPEQTARREGYLRLVEAGNFAAVVEERIPILLHPGRRADPALTSAIRRMAAATGPETFLRQQRAVMSRPDSRPQLRDIHCPTLIVYGREDGIVSFAHQEELCDGIAGARLEVIEDCGHLVTLERPEAVNAVLRDWLRE